MDSAGGEDLSWFWRGWFFENWNCDLAVTKVAYVDGDPAKGATVTIVKRDRLPMPAWVEVVFTDGTKTRLHIPAEAWIQQRELDLPVDSTKSIACGDGRSRSGRPRCRPPEQHADGTILGGRTPIRILES